MELPVRPKSGRVQRQERLTTRRDIISNDVPVEMLQRIFSYLHDPGDERWTGKEDLKAVSLTCKKFRAAGMRDLYRDMTLKFMYTYDWDQGHWKAPKLVELVKRRPEMKALVRTLRLIVIPLDDESIIQLMTRPAYRVREELVAHIEKRLDRLPNQFAPCVSDHPDNAQRAAQDGTMDGDTQEARSIRYFGRASGNPKHPIQEVAKSVYRRKKKRQVFADYVLCTMRGLSETFKGLNHLIAGDWNPDEENSCTESVTASTYGQAFASAIICETQLSPNISSLGIHHAPLHVYRTDSRFGFLRGAARCHVEAIADQLRHLSFAELSVTTLCDRIWFPIMPPNREGKRWTRTIPYWSDVLPKFKKVTTLHLADACRRRKRLWKYAKDELYLGHLVDIVRLPMVKRLCLARWNVTPSIVAKLPRAFPGLTELEFEGIHLFKSEEQHPWRKPIKELQKRYESIQIWVDGVKIQQKQRRHRQY